MSIQRSWNKAIINNWKSQLRQRGSHKRVSGEPGVVQSKAVTHPDRFRRRPPVEVPISPPSQRSVAYSTLAHNLADKWGRHGTDQRAVAQLEGHFSANRDVKVG